MGTDLSAKLAKLAAHVDAARDGVAAINRSEPLAAALYDAYRKGELVTRADAQAAVEAAVEVERERCAVIAENADYPWEEGEHLSQMFASDATACAIAAAIREVTP